MERPEAIDLMRQWYKFGDEVEAKVSNVFESKARFISRRPVIISVILLLLATLCGIGLLKVKTVVSTGSMWTPAGSEASKDLHYIEANFGNKPRGGPILIKGGNIVTLEAFEVMWDVHEKIVNEVQADGKKYADMCQNRDVRNDNCMVYGALQFFNANRTLYNIQVQTVQQLRARISAPLFPDGTGVLRDQIFSGCTFGAITPPNPLPAIISCNATAQIYFIEQEPLDRAMSWERKMLKAVEGFDNEYVTVERNSNSAFDDTLARASRGDVAQVTVMYALFILMTFFTLWKGFAWTESRIGLSITGLCLLFLAVVSGFGICSGLGAAMISMHTLIPFISACIGTTNMYVIVAAFDAQDPSLTVEERIGRAMRQCGKSVLYTSLSATVAFYLGGASEYMGVRAFCYYAGTTVFVNYVLLANVFVAALCLDAQRRDSGRMDLLCCMEGAKPAAAAVPTADPDAGDDSAVAETQGAPTTAVPTPPVESPTAAPACPSLTPLQRFFAEVYCPVLAHPAARVFLFLGMWGILIANIFGTTHVSQDLNIAQVVPKGSPVRDFIETARPIGLFPAEQSAPVEFVLPYLEYHETDIQLKILALQNEFLADTENHKGPMISWLSAFYTRYVPALPNAGPPLALKNCIAMNGNGVCANPTLFYTFMHTFLNTAGHTFAKDVVFTFNNAGSSRIKMSRVSGFLTQMRGPKNIVDNMDDMRDFIANMSFPMGMNETLTLGPDVNSTLRTDAFTYSPPFIKGEGYKISFPEFVWVMGAGVIGVAVMSMLLLKPHGILATGVAVCTIIAIYVNVVGNFVHWGWIIHINFMSITMITMTIAQMIVYSLHFLQHYHTQAYSIDPMERMKTALMQVGPSLFMGGLTALIAIVPMAFAESYAFQVFFRVYFCTILYSMGHGLVLLPVLLPALFYASMEPCVAAREDFVVTGKEVELTDKPPSTAGQVVVEPQAVKAEV